MKAIIRQNVPIDTGSLADVPSFTVPRKLSQISNEERSEILSQAPDQLTLFNDLTQEFVTVPVVYVNNIAYITLSKELYPLLASEIPELLGRTIMVRPLSGHRYVDQATAYQERGSRRNNRGAIVAPEEVQRRRAERNAAERKSAGVISSQANIASAVKRSNQRRGRGFRGNGKSATYGETTDL
jgi:hypothetical protein